MSALSQASNNPSRQKGNWATVELCTIPSYLNYILLYSAWLYKPAQIHYILFRLRLDCPRVLDCIPGPSPGHPNARGLVLHPPAEARTPKNFRWPLEGR
jgi:hypothetical protein